MNAKPRRSHEAIAALLLVTVVISVVLFVIAASAYPGGTHFDHAAVGHDFWKNTLCDVARTTAVGGAPNLTGAVFARLAMTSMALGIGALFWLLPDRFPARARLGASVRVLGSVCVPGAVAVVFLPTDQFGVLHGIAIVVAGIPGLAAAVLAVIGLVGAVVVVKVKATTTTTTKRATRPRPDLLVTTLGVLALVVAAVDFGLYVHELVVGGPASLAVSVLERIAVLVILGWMIAVARASRRIMQA